MTCRVNKIKMVSMVTPVIMVSLIKIGTFGQKDQNSMLSASGASFFQPGVKPQTCEGRTLFITPFKFFWHSAAEISLT